MEPRHGGEAQDRSGGVSGQGEISEAYSVMADAVGEPPLEQQV
jgi:hypothetical protein